MGRPTALQTIVLLLYLTVHYNSTTGTTFRPTTTPPTTIPNGLDGECFYEGAWYADGETISTDPGGCSGMVCIGGGIAYWDDWCAFYSSTPDTTTPPTTPTPPRTTIPTGWCLWEGVWYPDGKEIASETCKNPLCCGAICTGGSISFWDHECSPALAPPPPCDGWNEYVDYQCCPICHSNKTTTPPTTTPPTTTPPLPFCFHHGQLYNNYMCIRHRNFRTSAYDIETSQHVYPIPKTKPTCTTSKRFPMLMTTLCRKCDACLDDIFDLDQNGCHGKECHYGAIRPWRKQCSVKDDNCDGNLVNVTGQCCPICEVPVKTTLPSNETQSTSESTPTTSKTCVIRGETYGLNMRTNSDECNKCYCTSRGEECHVTICDDVSDCVNTYRLKGECCFKCSNGLREKVALLLLLSGLLINLVIK